MTWPRRLLKQDAPDPLRLFFDAPSFTGSRFFSASRHHRSLFHVFAITSRALFLQAAILTPLRGRIASARAESAGTSAARTAPKNLPNE